MIDTSQEESTVSSADNDVLQRLRQLRDAGEPIVLAINGETQWVVQDHASYQKLLELVDCLQTLAVIREGIAAADRGEGRPAEEVFAEIRRKHHLPPRP